MAKRPDVAPSSAAPSQAPLFPLLAPMSVRAEVAPATVNDQDRTVELVFTTGAAIRRMDWWTGQEYMESLSLDPAHVRIDRLNSGAPLLDSHNNFSVADIFGTTVAGSVTLTKREGRVKVRFSKRDAVEPVWQDVRDGIIKDVSIGYRVYKFEETAGKGEALPMRKAVDWEPFEVSMVPIPADAGAKVRSGGTADANPCEIVAVSDAEEPAPPAEEKSMNEQRSLTIVEGDPLTAPAPTPAPAVVEQNERDLGIAAERDRVDGIRQACLAGRMTRSFEDGLIRDGVSLVEAQRRVFAELQRRDAGAPAQTPTGGRVLVGDDPLVHVRAGIANALLHRISPERHALDEIGRAYRGMSVLDIGRAFLSARGVRVTSLSRSQLVDQMLARSGGLASTSDFSSLLEDVAHKNLRSAYEAAPQTWLPIARTVNLADFKASRQLQIGDAPALDEILEHGEYTFGSIAEAKESITLKTYGKIFGITRQALINDDLGAFGEIPAAFGRKARDKESDLAWAQITANPTMGDGVALFDATTHTNYTSSGTAISVDSLGVGRAAMRKQKGIDGVTPLNLTPRYLIVPVGKETIADQYVSQIQPALGSSVNPFSPGGRTPLSIIAEPRLDANSATAWYLACGAEQAPVLLYGLLDGAGGPDLRQEEGFSMDGVKFRCRLDVAFKAADWHAVYKNAGA